MACVKPSFHQHPTPKATIGLTEQPKRLDLSTMHLKTLLSPTPGAELCQLKTGPQAGWLSALSHTAEPASLTPPQLPSPSIVPF